MSTQANSARAPGPKARAFVERDGAVVSPSYTRSYPFVMARGEGSLAWDVDGNEFIDFCAGVAVTSTGHSHPRVVEAIRRQAGEFIHMSGTDFYYPVQIELAERLVELAPGEPAKQVFFTNSGAEAIEAALKLARYATRRTYVVTFLGGFHGRTLGALSLTASKAVQRDGFGALLPGVIHLPFPDPYRGALGRTGDEAAVAVLEHLEQTVFTQLVAPTEVAAIFVEPIQGEGGYVVPPDGFLPGLSRLARQHGIVFVADEVQTGVGRTGRWLAVEHWGVEPDIVCLAKGIASGMPLGAMLARRDLMTWPPGAHGNTFGGNPLSCAAALATLEVIGSERLLAHAAQTGERMLDAFQEMMDRHPSIGHVRGKGLMLALELVEDRETKSPHVGLRDSVVEKAFERGLLILGCGPSSVRFMPALNIDRPTVETGLLRFEEALTEAERAV
ncbi:MAG: acetyl ornithine aminotransferase family protein [Anaerolineae bacterium]